MRDSVRTNYFILNATILQRSREKELDFLSLRRMSVYLGAKLHANIVSDGDLCCRLSRAIMLRALIPTRHFLFNNLQEE